MLLYWYTFISNINLYNVWYIIKSYLMSTFQHNLDYENLFGSFWDDSQWNL